MMRPLLCFIALFFGDPLWAEVGDCEFQKEMKARLAEEYREVPVLLGLSGNQFAVEIYANAGTKTWTATSTNTQGVSCIFDEGGDWFGRDTSDQNFVSNETSDGKDRSTPLELDSCEGGWDSWVAPDDFSGAAIFSLINTRDERLEFYLSSSGDRWKIIRKSYDTSPCLLRSGTYLEVIKALSPEI